MASTDIYENNEIRPGTRAEPVRRRSRRRVKTFDQAVRPDYATTHRRRSRNTGLRRFRHLMKKPEFSRRFWIWTMGGLGLLLILLIAWELLIRNPYNAERPTEDPPTQRAR